MTVDQIIDDLLVREGGFADRPGDRGGPTKFGITAATLGIWRSLGRPATRAEVQAMSEHEARDIYAAEYIAHPGFGAIACEPLQVLLVDAAVNHGVARAIRMLQVALGFTGRRVDGILGRETRAAVAALTDERSREIYRHVLRQRGELYLSLALDSADVCTFLEQHPTSQLTFLRGWIRRLLEFAS